MFRKGMWKAAVAAVMIAAVVAVAATGLSACDDFSGRKNQLRVETFRSASNIILPITTTGSSNWPTQHGVKYFASKADGIAVLLYQIVENRELKIRQMRDYKYILIERVDHIFADGEWRAYADIAYVKPYAPEEGSDFAKKKINYYAGNCECEIYGEDGKTTMFLLPVYLLDLERPEYMPAEGEWVTLEGSADEVREFYLHSGCDVQANGNAFIVSDRLGSARKMSRKMATKYRISIENGMMGYEILEIEG